MKVAVVFSSLPAEGGGGHTFERSLRSGLDELSAESRHEFVTFVPGGGQPGEVPIRRTRRDGFRKVGRRGLLTAQDRMGMPRAAWRTSFQRTLDERGIDFVWFASFYFEECEQPHMATVWDLAHLEYPWFPEFGSRGQWERRQAFFERYLKRSARIVVPNAALTDLLTNAYGAPRGRIVEIPFATPEWALDPPSTDDDEVLRRHGIEEPYLLYPAQFWAHKNHTTALEVVSELRGAGEETQLVLVGSDQGTEAHVRARASALRLSERVHFLGFVDQADLVSLYRRAHALLYLSFLGPANLPPLEAGALGCPIVCADVTGMRLQLGEAALFAPPTDVGAIAGAVRTLRDPGTRDSLTAAGRELAGGLTARGYVGRVLEELDAFERVRATWRH